MTLVYLRVWNYKQKFGGLKHQHKISGSEKISCYSLLSPLRVLSDCLKNTIYSPMKMQFSEVCHLSAMIHANSHKYRKWRH